MTDEERYAAAGRAMDQIAEVIAKTRELVEAMQEWLDNMAMLLSDEEAGDDTPA